MNKNVTFEGSKDRPFGLLLYFIPHPAFCSFVFYNFFSCSFYGSLSLWKISLSLSKMPAFSELWEAVLELVVVIYRIDRQNNSHSRNQSVRIRVLNCQSFSIKSHSTWALKATTSFSAWRHHFL